MPGRSFDSPSSRNFAPARLRPEPPPAVALLPAVSWVDVPAEASSVVTARSLTTVVRSWAYLRMMTTHSRPCRIPSWRRMTSILHVELICQPWYPSRLLSFPHLSAPGTSISSCYCSCRIARWRSSTTSPVGWKGRPRPPGGGRAALRRRRPAGSQLSVRVLCKRGADSSTTLTWCRRRGLLLKVFLLLFLASSYLFSVYESRP
jgi:hypothetical protein